MEREQVQSAECRVQSKDLGARLLCAIIMLLVYAPLGITSAAEPNSMTTRDGRIQVQLPDGYTEQPPVKKEISLQAVNESKDATIFIITENQKDFDSLAAYAELVRGLMLDKLRDGQADAGEKLEISGNPAIRYEITGMSQGFRLAYQLTVIQTETRFNQVLASTTRKQFADCKEEFEKVAKSLKELPAKPPEKPGQEKK